MFIILFTFCLFRIENNLFIFWQVAEDKDVPARVTLLEIPSKNEVRVKNLFNVADCKMHWQKTGDYLCVKVKNIILVFKYRNKARYFQKKLVKYYIYTFLGDL